MRDYSKINEITVKNQTELDEIPLYFRQTGRFALGCDNRDLQEFYEKEGK